MNAESNLTARLADLRERIAGIPSADDPALIRRKSRDYSWFSPVLRAQLENCVAHLLVSPETEDQVVRIAAACADLRIPLTVRGAGSGNYGQAVPLHGGVVMETTSLDQLIWIKGDRIRVQAGIRLSALDEIARARGLEIRHFPSTKRMATAGGYFAGGSAGVGSVRFGGLREPGNLLGARIVTLEREPRRLELSEHDAGFLLHAFGTTGIVTEVEMPLSEARPWRDFVVSFADVYTAAAFGRAVSADSAVEKNLMSFLAAPMVQRMRALQALIPRGGDVAICMIAEQSLVAFRGLVERYQGTIELEADSIAAERDPNRTPLYEYTWGHSSLLALRTSPELTYVQVLCQGEDMLKEVKLLFDAYPDRVLLHGEYILYGGELALLLLPMVTASTPEQLREITAFCDTHGMHSADAHVSTVEDSSGYKKLPLDLLSFKRSVDPYGVLNPGKMRSYVPLEP